MDATPQGSPGQYLLLREWYPHLPGPPPVQGWDVPLRLPPKAMGSELQEGRYRVLQVWVVGSALGKGSPCGLEAVGTRVKGGQFTLDKRQTFLT